MAAKIYYEKDCNPKVLAGKTVAILGYGSQGHAHAQNLRDSGVKVIVAELPGSDNYELAKSHGFEPLTAEEATKQADVMNILLPDELQAEVLPQEHPRQPQPGNILVCSHGFNVHFNQIEPPKGVDLLLVAPKGPGPPGPQRVRRRRRRPLPHRRRARAPATRPSRSAWPTPTASAAPARASSRPPSPKRPRPTFLASRPCSAAAPPNS